MKSNRVTLGVAFWALCGHGIIAQDTNARDTVKAWETKSGVRLTSEATKVLAQDEFLKGKSWHKSKFDPVSDSPLDDWIVDAYLYEVRDKIIPTTSNGRATITVEDINRVPFKAFRLSAVTLSTKPGRLAVHSTPVGATIQIDGEEKGQTDKNFILSVGSHAIQIVGGTGLQCSRSVTITAGVTTPLNCP